MIERISSEIQMLNTSWQMISLLLHIEKFDSEWPSLQRREFAVLDTFKIIDPQPSHKIYADIIDLFAGNVDSVKVQAFADFKCLYDWYKTELDIPALIKCLLFNYLMLCIDPENHLLLLVVSEFTTSLLAECDYNWVCYFKTSYPRPQEINKWVFDVLSDLRDSQQMLRRKSDLYGAGSKLTMHEQLLIHIIENHRGISTKAIIRKVGKSEATVRRMLAKLRQLNFIVTSRSLNGFIKKEKPATLFAGLIRN